MAPADAPRVVTVSTIKDSLPNVQKFVHRNLSSGVDHMIVFVDAPAPRVVAFLHQHPDVTAIRTGPEYWAGRRPPRLNDRQFANANLAKALLAPFPWAAWLFHIDGDEVVDVDRTVLGGVPSDVHLVRLNTLEAVSRFRWKRDVTHFKRLLDEGDLHLLVALGAIDKPRNSSYFRGHRLGKSGIRPSLQVQLRLHTALDNSGAELDAFESESLNLLHYESYSGEEFVRKWMAHVHADAGQPSFRRQRDELRAAIAGLLRKDLPDKDREDFLRRLYERHVADDMDTLRRLGLLVERPARDHVAVGLTRDQRSLLDVLCDHLVAADKCHFSEDADVGGVADLMKRVAGQAGVPAELASGIDDLLARKPVPVARLRPEESSPTRPGEHSSSRP